MTAPKYETGLIGLDRAVRRMVQLRGDLFNRVTSRGEAVRKALENERFTIREIEAAIEED
jgi:hypothetical protein